MSGTIAGTMYDSATGIAIPTAVASAPPPYHVNNYQGTYFFLTVGTATVDVTATAPGYTPQTISVTVVNGGMKRQDFALVHV